MFLDGGRVGPSSIVLPGVFFASISALAFGWYAPMFAAQYGLPVIDDVVLHSREQTLHWMSEYTPAARHSYLVFLLLDCIFPVAGSLFTITVARVALTSFDRERSVLRFMLLLPALAALADLLENVCHAALTLLYPEHAEWLASLAWALTRTKLFFVVGAQVVLVTSLLALASKQLLRLRSLGS